MSRTKDRPNRVARRTRSGGDEHLPVVRPERRSRRVLVAAAALAVAFVVGGVGWRLATAARERGSGPPNVVLITLDTTRADHLGCYGHPAVKTPNIDRLAAEGARFAQCVTAAPSTLPSHATIMTGLYPFVHGVRDNVGFRLPESARTLAEVLRERGYATAAFVAAIVLNRGVGLEQGFDTYDDVGARHERRAGEVSDAAIAWLQAHAGQQFFLWTHFFDPHAPYQPPEPFRSQYADPYQGEIAYTDQQVGRLLDELKRLKLDRRTLVVLTADHGEGRGEHGEETHLYFVYDSTMLVPLIIRQPRTAPAGRVVPQQVRTIDIAPTVLALLGLRPADLLPEAQGEDLTGLWDGRSQAADLPAYGESLGGHLVFGLSPLRCLREGGWKYIHAPRAELYQVAGDGGEQANRADAEPGRLAAMRERLRAIIAEAPAPIARGGEVARMDRSTIDRLESLGYVAGTRSAGDLAGDELARFEPVGADPKDHHEDIALIGQATHAEQNGEHAAAEEIHRRLMASFPDSIDLGLRLARSIFLQNRLPDAIAVYRDLLARRPDNAEAHYGLAKLLSRTGVRAEALDHFQEAARLDPLYPEAHYDLGVMLMRVGRRSEAVTAFQQVLALRPSDVDALVNLGSCLASEGRLDEAVAHYRAALAIAPNEADIHYNLGNALYKQGNPSGAIAEYEQALRLKPDLAPARQALEATRRGK